MRSERALRPKPRWQRRWDDQGPAMEALKEREREREGVMISLFLWRLNQTGDCKRGQETQEANQKRDYALSGIRGVEGLGV